MTFGEKLRKARNEKGMMQTELAKAAGLGVNTIINYESGRTYPKNREVYNTLAEILGVNANYLKNENEEFVTEAGKKYGYKGMKQAQHLVDEIGGLFAGGELSEAEKDGVMRALQEVYWECKEVNIEKYTPKKYRKKKSQT